MKQVSVSQDGEYIWGVNSNDNIYYRHGKDGSWQRILGGLKYVSVGNDDVTDTTMAIWGVNSSDSIYKIGRIKV